MKMTGGQMIVKYLEKENVPYVLGIPGHGILGFFDALRKKIRRETLLNMHTMNMTG